MLFFPLPSLFSYFYFWKENSFVTLGYKNIEAQNLTQILRISTSTEFKVKIQLNPSNSNTGLLKSNFYFLKLFFLPSWTFLNRYFSLKTTR